MKSLRSLVLNFLAIEGKSCVIAFDSKELEEINESGASACAFIKSLGFECRADYSYVINSDKGNVSISVDVPEDIFKSYYACQFCLGKQAWTKIDTTGQVLNNLEARADRKCISCGRELIVAEMINIKGPYIMVEPVSKDMKTKAGLVVPATCWNVWRMGKVVRLGEPLIYHAERAGGRNGYYSPVVESPTGRSYARPDVKVGEVVMFQNTAVHSLRVGCNAYFLLHYDDVDLIVESFDTIVPM